MQNARATFPAAAIFPPALGALPCPSPGSTTNLTSIPAANGFFNFNDFNADYWFVTGVPVPAQSRGARRTLPTGLDHSARTQQRGFRHPDRHRGQQWARPSSSAASARPTIPARITFPVDVVIIEWDGRALGVPPLNRYTRPILVKAGTPIVHSTARRWGAILNSTVRVGQRPRQGGIPGHPERRRLCRSPVAATC